MHLRSLLYLLDKLNLNIAGAFEHQIRKVPHTFVAQLYYDCAKGTLAVARLKSEDVNGYFCLGELQVLLYRSKSLAKASRLHMYHILTKILSLVIVISP